ncbi:histidine kinase [Rothia sp. SD9660Na]|uniref:sensor histidine kinase n=1 Tax=Rothia sp. SD9660Na TaxID=3047030 RepID=UPI0024B905FC|nr:histidine kinase [Rothia sp. SD9660Na]WHS50691.1 histidine kinase [Rothia sp. SD9660Na]
MTIVPPAPPATSSQQTLLVLKILRVSLHVMFAFLLCFGAILALIGSVYQVRHAALGVLSLVLGGVYLAGTVYENRQGLPTTLTTRFTPALLWLLIITLLWLGLMALDSSFTWVVFPIMFLYLHLLTPLAGVAATLVLCALAIALPLVGPAGFGLDYLLAEGLAPGYLIGPTLGALLAIVISFTYRALRADAARQYQLAQQLRAVHAELVQQQYSAGKLEERERLAREIHDTLAQGLSSIVLVSRAAASSLQEGKADAAAAQVRVIQDSAAANLAEARRFIRDLSSPALDDSLVSALRALAASTETAQKAAGKPLTCAFILEGKEETANALPEAVSATLMRVAQGALANVAAHAEASRAALTLSIWPGEVTLDIFDNGRGFTPTPLVAGTLSETGTGYGLTSLGERVARLDGSLDIESTPGEGTVLTARIPLNQHRPEQEAQ